MGLRIDLCHPGSSTKGRRLARDALVPGLSRILRLALAPDIIEAIFSGRAGQSVMLEKSGAAAAGELGGAAQGLRIGGSYDRE